MPRPRRRILLLLDSSQADAFLATGHALLQLGAEVHLASSSGLASAVRSTSADLTFHPLPSTTTTRFPLKSDDASPALFPCHGIVSYLIGVPFLLRLSSLAILPWTGPSCVAVYHAATRLLRALRPDVVAVHPAFAPAVTACQHAGQRFVVLAPGSIKDFALPFQPAGAVFWKYPCIASDLPFPVPWHLVLLNVIHNLVALLVARSHPTRYSLQHYVRDCIGSPLTTLDDLVWNPPTGVPYLVASRPEIELPLRTLPPHIVSCGPILPVAPAVAESDPALARWLSRAPTICVDVEGGRDATVAETVARSVMALLAKARGTHSHLQVFWGLNDSDGANGFLGTPAGRVLGPGLKQDVVRLRQPVSGVRRASVLEHGSVVCAVICCGGSETPFLEAVAAGVPQTVVVLPEAEPPGRAVDVASRVEVLGIGRWGNKATRPGCGEAELGAALEEVVLGRRAGEMRRRAAELAAVCGREPGRMVAARAILAEM